MSDYTERVKALREHADLIETSIELYGPSATRLLVYDLRNAAAAIEALETEVRKAENQRTSHLRAITKLIREKHAQPHWVSVEDELPKSGTHVLACCEVHGINGYRGHYVCDAFHTDKKSIPCSYNDDIDEEYDEETDEYYFPVGWWEVVKNWDDYSCVAINDVVTYWMPLPEPPQEVQDERRA